MSRTLWRPTAEYEGVNIHDIRAFSQALSVWRDNYLLKVGVPKDYEGEWDFVQVSYLVVFDRIFRSLDSP
jgi:hypothetical protein